MTEQSSGSEPTYTRYRFGTAEFNEATLELRVAGLKVDVEPRALQVLGYLLRHAGEVVTKEELLGQVWSGLVTVDKVLPNAITKLRRALGGTNADLLVTQPRIGYRLAGVTERITVGRRLPSPLALEVGQPVPRRENFLLQRQLGGRSDGEVWLATHARTREPRVYKFATSSERLGSLKREATLARVLHESLDDTRHFVEMIDWNFESPPFFLECGYGGDNLHEWGSDRLADSGIEQRLGVFLQIADAVAAAHGVGVLHKDLKPANVLVDESEGRVQVRLTDFGSGGLFEPGRLDELGITRFGLPTELGLRPDSSSTTPLYVAPEVFAGHTPTVQSDLYSLGVILYQLLAGDLNKPMASGWEHDIADELLREDIRLATSGAPERRLASVGELAARLRALDQRRHQQQQAQDLAEQSRLARESLARSRARRPYLYGLVAVLVAGLATSLWLYRLATDARDQARQELESANAINRFLNQDLIGQSNPTLAKKGREATIDELLLSARQEIAGRFAGKPLIEASIRTSISTLFNTIERLAESEEEARQALALYQAELGPDHIETLKAKVLLVRLLTRTGKSDECLALLEELDRQTGDASDPQRRFLRLSAWGLWHMNRGEFAQALDANRAAIPLLRQIEPDNTALLDSMRLDTVYALIMTEQPAQAREEGEALATEIAARPDDNGLVLAFAQAAVGKALASEKRFDEAEAESLQAQKAVVALLGADHTRNLMIESDLLDLAMQRQQWPKAVAHGRRIHDGFRSKFGAEHPFTNLTALNLGQALFANGDDAEARDVLAAAHPYLLAQYQASHPRTQTAAFRLAVAHLALGEVDAAATLLADLDVDALHTGTPDGYWQPRLDIANALLSLQRDNRRAGTRDDLAAAIEKLAGSDADERLVNLARNTLIKAAADP